jgi:hypothetical protein
MHINKEQAQTYLYGIDNGKNVVAEFSVKEIMDMLAAATEQGKGPEKILVYLTKHGDTPLVSMGSRNYGMFMVAANENKPYFDKGLVLTKCPIPPCTGGSMNGETNIVDQKTYSELKNLESDNTKLLAKINAIRGI